MDMYGKSIYLEKTQGNLVMVQVNEYPDGLYLVKLKFEGRVYTAKFLKSSH